MYIIHKRVPVILYSLNTNSLDDVETVALTEFGKLHKIV